MGAVNDYPFQEAGEIEIDDGTTPVKFTNVVGTPEITIDGEPEYSDRTVAGDDEADNQRGIDPIRTVRVTVEVLDEAGTSNDAKAVTPGGTYDTNLTLTLFPEGDQVGNPKRALTAMDLVNENHQFPMGQGKPPVRYRWEFMAQYKNSAVPQWADA